MARPLPQHSSQPLDLRRILAIYVPLALSWLFMAVEGPADMAMLGLAPDYKINASGFLLVLGLSIWIESPVIDLLSTSTALGSSRERWVALSAFTWAMMATVFCAHALVAFTPLYDIITVQLMGVKPDIAAVSKVPFQIMTPWSAMVGWRRYLHGIMIKHGNTRPISVGTVVRIIALCAVGFPLVQFSPLNGLWSVAVAMVVAVGSESLFIHFASRHTIRHLPHRPEETIGPLELAKFHLPLTASTMVMLSGPVLVTRALARSGNQELTLAGWQTATSIGWLFRSMTFALPEAVISLYAPGAADRLLKKFCLIVGGALTALVLLFHFTGLDGLWFTLAYGTSPETTEVSRLAFLACAALPFVGGVMAYYRGVLTAHHVTIARVVAIAAAILALFLGLEIGLALTWPGVVVAAFGLTLSQLTENGALAVYLKRWTRKNPERFETLPAEQHAENVATINLGGTTPAPDHPTVLRPHDND